MKNLILITALNEEAENIEVGGILVGGDDWYFVVGW